MLWYMYVFNTMEYECILYYAICMYCIVWNMYGFNTMDYVCIQYFGIYMYLILWYVCI